MTTNDYQPISCDLHSEYELLAMHRTPVVVQYRDEDGTENHFQGRVIDVSTRQDGEYLKLEGEETTVEIRLDRILRLRKH